MSRIQAAVALYRTPWVAGAFLIACAGRPTADSGGGLRDAGSPDGGGAAAGSGAADSGLGGVGGVGGRSGASDSGARDAGAGGSPASGGGGSAGTPVTYDEWLALDCDCTPEKPCPMLCGGVTDLPPSPSLDPTWARAVCDVALSPRLSCEVYPPSLRGEAAEAVGAYYKCGSVIAHSRGFDYGMHFGEVTQFFSPGALERTGWEYRYAPAYRICGGVVPPRQCLEDRDEPTDLCVSDQTPNQPCECPPPPCTLCPNGRDCDEHADCISGRCRGLDQGASRGTCSAPQTCSDGVLTAPESDVDCGGAGVCPACEAGKACVVDADCRSQRCAGGICAAP